MAYQNRDDVRYQFHLTWARSRFITGYSRQLMMRGKAVRTGPCAGEETKRARLFSQAEYGVASRQMQNFSNAKSSFSLCSVFREAPLYGYIETALLSCAITQCR
jgi:hypothetical protein